MPAAWLGDVARKDRTVFILACMIFLTPALGVPSQELLQDTLKSMLVSFGALSAALLFVWPQRERREPWRWHALMGFPLVLMAYALGSMAWSHAYLAGVEAIRWFIVAVMVWLGLNSFSRERLPTLAWGIHLGALVASVWTALQFWFDFRYFSQGPQPASTFLNRNFFAEFVVCALPFSAYLLAQARRSGQIAALAVTTGIIMVALLMTGTRSALAALWLLLFLVLPLIALRYRRQLAFSGWTAAQRLIALGLLLATVAGLGLINTGNPSIAGEAHGRNALERGLYRSASVIDELTDSEKRRTGSVSVRMVMWKATGRMIFDRPFSGVGAGAWEVDAPLYQAAGSQLETDYYAHNEFLQLLAEYGLVGWAALIGLLSYLARSAWRSWRDRSPQGMEEGSLRAVALSSLLALLIVSCAGFPWRLATTGAMFALCLGILAASDARLGIGGRAGARLLNWTPGFSKTAAYVLVLCLGLAGYISAQAVRCEAKLIRAVQLALMVSQAGDVNHPRWNRVKRDILRLTRDGIAINPHYRKITPMVADQLASWGDWGNATWIWESVLQSRPYVVAMMTNVARGAAQAGDYQKALDYLARCQKLQPRAVSVRSLEVFLLSRTGQEAQATRLAQQYLQEGSYDYDLLSTASALGLRSGDYALAIQSLLLRNQGWPAQRVDGFLKLGAIYAAYQKDEAKALASYRAALAAGPADAGETIMRLIPPAYRSRL
jgi:O-antigen ligase